MLFGTDCGATPLLCDVTDDGQVQAVVNQALALHGHQDVLVNAAGILLNDKVASITDIEWMRALDINATRDVLNNSNS